MKAIQAIFLIGLLFVGCSAPSGPEHQVTAYLPGSLPDNWTATCTTDSKTFRPLRGLTNAVAQITLVNNSDTIEREYSPGNTEIFHPSIILLVFDKSELQIVEQAVIKEMSRSDFPPIFFGLTDKYIFVTSPGYINHGLHTADADAIINKLKTSLRGFMEIR